MLNEIETFEHLITEAYNKMVSISDQNASEKSRPGKWSKKEILGHLIDSAANNHQRFVRMQIADKLELPQYQQNEWVKYQRYNDRPWNELVEFWKNYNTHLLFIVKQVGLTKLQHTANFPEYGILTLQFLIEDYVVHMRHHLAQILDEK